MAVTPFVPRVLLGRQLNDWSRGGPSGGPVVNGVLRTGEHRLSLPRTEAPTATTEARTAAAAAVVCVPCKRRRKKSGGKLRAAVAALSNATGRGTEPQYDVALSNWRARCSVRSAIHGGGGVRCAGAAVKSRIACCERRGRSIASLRVRRRRLLTRGQSQQSCLPTSEHRFLFFFSSSGEKERGDATPKSAHAGLVIRTITTPDDKNDVQERKKKEQNRRNQKKKRQTEEEEKKKDELLLLFSSPEAYNKRR